jgi:hypothetical protein
MISGRSFRIRLILLLFVFFSDSRPLFSGDGHHSQPNEIGASIDYIRLDHENKEGLGLHLHLARRLQESGLLSAFGLGTGFECIFSDHNHYGIMGSLLIYPFDDLVCVVSPGLVMSEHHGDFVRGFAAHFEASYGFYIHGFEIGPVIGYSRSSEDNHYSAGIHFAKSFD